MKRPSAGILLLSDRPEDMRLAESIARSLGVSFQPISDFNQGVEAVTRYTGERPFLFVDAEHAHAFADFQRKLCASGGEAEKKVGANCVHFIGEDELASVPALLQSPLFGTYIQRNFGEPEVNPAAAYARHLRIRLDREGFSLKGFLRPGTTIKNVRLGNTEDRGVVIEAVQSAARAGGFKGRVAGRIAMCVDELLMNAIFDAPVSATGFRLYEYTSRTANFKLTGKSSVEFQIGFDGATLGVSVRDRFGSLDKLKFLAHIARTDPELNEIAASGKAGAGLGLAAVYQTGCDMFFHCERGACTDVVLLFKQAVRAREGRSEFRILGTYFK